MCTYIEARNAGEWMWLNKIKLRIFSFQICLEKIALTEWCTTPESPWCYSLDAVCLSILLAVSDLHNICANSHV